MSAYCDAFPDFYACDDVVARKEHACCECDAKILVGEKHYKATGKWEGVVSTYRQHTTCGDACMLIRDEFEGGECISFGGLFEWYGEFKEDTRVWATEDGGKRDAAKQFRSMIATIRKRERR